MFTGLKSEDIDSALQAAYKCYHGLRSSRAELVVDAAAQGTRSSGR
jgi:hypothetical protein